MSESLELEITYLPIKDLRPDPTNPRRISDGGIAADSRVRNHRKCHRAGVRIDGYPTAV